MHENDFIKLIYLVEESINRASNRVFSHGKFFKTEAEYIDLYDILLENLPPEIRQAYNCNTCREFVNRYGSLVEIDASYVAHPVAWNFYDDVGVFTKGIREIQRIISISDVTGVYVPDTKTMGIKRTNDYLHLHGKLNNRMVRRNKSKSAKQIENDYRKGFVTLLSGMDRYDRSIFYTIKDGIPIDLYYREIKHPLSYLAIVYDKYHANNIGIVQKRNLIWKQIAKMPSDYHKVLSQTLYPVLNNF